MDDAPPEADLAADLSGNGHDRGEPEDPTTRAIREYGLHAIDANEAHRSGLRSCPILVGAYRDPLQRRSPSP